MAHTRVELPLVAREFLRTESGRWCKPSIRLLHRWISEQRLALTALTETHIEQFWQQQRLCGVAMVTTSACAIDKTNPDRMLRDVISYLRNHARGDRNAQRLITRIHKLRHEIAHLDAAPCSP
jgi:IS5 family transposase